MTLSDCPPEVHVALNYLISFLYNKLPRRRVDVFAEELASRLQERFRGNWYADQPDLGATLRVIRAGSTDYDQILVEAIRASGLSLEEVLQELPPELTICIDPGQVTYRAGSSNHVVLYSNTNDTPPQLASPIAEDQNTLAFVAQRAQVQQQQSHHFTTAMFAQTKFGSTKLRTQPRRPTRLNDFGTTTPGRFWQPTSPSSQQPTPASQTNGAVGGSYPSTPNSLSPYGLNGEDRYMESSDWNGNRSSFYSPLSEPWTQNFTANAWSAADRLPAYH